MRANIAIALQAQRGALRLIPAARQCELAASWMETLDIRPADPERAATLAILTSIPGIGPRIASLLATDLPELGQIDRKAIASLAGLAPHVSQSGSAPPRAAIAGGRPCVRAALYMAALVAVRHDPWRKAEYDAMRQAGKPAKLALIAIARKLVVTANALVKNNRPYQNQTIGA